MFKKLLVALDTSTPSEEVFLTALDLAQVHQASLLLLHVLSTQEDGSPNLADLSGLGYYPMADEQILEAYQERWQAYEKRGWDQLQFWSEKALASGVAVESTQTLGQPGPCICQIAQEADVDLILVGRRGRAGLTELVLGSVSNYVLHHAPCSVLVVQGEKVRARAAAMQGSSAAV
jgi:nucleotide-binding universal stress UspA family protein